MKSLLSPRRRSLALLAWAFLFAAVAPSWAGTVSVSSSAPTVDAYDIANYATQTSSDKFWAEGGSTAAGAAKGQTFRTGSASLWLRSITYRVTNGNGATPTKTYKVRVGKVSGTTFTQTHSETFTQSITWGSLQYMTWTFTTPIVLTGDTTYGIDVGMLTSTSDWTTGIPYLVVSGNEYLGGGMYDSGTARAGTGDNVVGYTVGKDRLFHLNLDMPTGTPMAFIAGNPADGTGGNLLRPGDRRHV